MLLIFTIIYDPFLPSYVIHKVVRVNAVYTFAVLLLDGTLHSFAA